MLIISNLVFVFPKIVYIFHKKDVFFVLKNFLALCNGVFMILKKCFEGKIENRTLTTEMKIEYFCRSTKKPIIKYWLIRNTIDD